MNKNVFLKQVKQVKEESYRDGVWDGMRMGFNITAIALNHIFGFGEERLSRLEAKVQELVDEMITTNDPYVNKVHIETAVKQIRGDKFFEDD